MILIRIVHEVDQIWVFTVLRISIVQNLLLSEWPVLLLLLDEFLVETFACCVVVRDLGLENYRSRISGLRLFNFLFLKNALVGFFGGQR